MKKSQNALFVGILLCISLSFSGCEEKPTKTDTALPVENSTEIIGGQEADLSQKNMPITQQEPLTQTVKEEKKQTDQEAASSDRLIFKNSNGTTYTLVMKEGKLIPDPQSKPILLINLFDIHDHGSSAQIPYLIKLQNEYGSRLTVLGIPTNQSLADEELKAFISKYQIDYFISYESTPETVSTIFSKLLDIDGVTTPTTLLYHEGERNALYEGAVPVEMITHDILMINQE